MIRLIIYIRKVFCKHDYVVEQTYVEDSNGNRGDKAYLFCKKCGYHSNHWKFIH